MALLVAAASACTVQLEMASVRAVPGDLSAASSGLAGHERWHEPDRDPARLERPSLEVARVSPDLALEAPVRLWPLPDRDAAAGGGPQAHPTGPAPAAPGSSSGTAPAAGLDLPARTALATLMPPPAKPDRQRLRSPGLAWLEERITLSRRSGPDLRLAAVLPAAAGPGSAEASGLTTGGLLAAGGEQRSEPLLLESGIELADSGRALQFALLVIEGMAPVEPAAGPEARRARAHLQEWRAVPAPLPAAPIRLFPHLQRRAS